jgi:DNA gyrase subunit A
MITELDSDLMVITAAGVVIRTDVTRIKTSGRATQGVTLIHLGEGDSVVAIATTNGKKPQGAEEDEVLDTETENEQAIPEEGTEDELVEAVADEVASPDSEE